MRNQIRLKNNFKLNLVTAHAQLGVRGSAAVHFNKICEIITASAYV